MGGSSDNAFDLLLAGVGIIAYGLLSMLSEYLPQYLSSQHIGLTIMIASTVGSLITAYCSVIGGYQHVDFSLLLEVGFFGVGLMWYKFRGHVRPVKGMEALFVGLAFACSVFEKGDVLEPNPNVKDPDQALAMSLVVVTAAVQFILDKQSAIGAVAWLLFGEWLIFTAWAVWLGESREHGYGMAHFSVLVILHCIGGAFMLPDDEHELIPQHDESSPLNSKSSPLRNVY